MSSQLRRHRRQSCSVQPVNNPDIPGERQGCDHWPVVALRPHKRPPALPGGLTQQTIFRCVRIVTFYIGESMVISDMADAPAIGIEPKRDRSDTVKPYVRPFPSQKRIVRRIMHDINGQQHCEDRCGEIPGKEQQPLLLPERNRITRKACPCQEHRFSQHATIGIAMIALL